MQVYGDRARRVRTATLLAEIANDLAALPNDAPRWRLRDRRARAFLAAGELAQGIADAGFEGRGEDHHAAAEQESLSLVSAIAAKAFDDAPGDSWRGPFTTLAAICAAGVSEEIVIKLAEGHAFYAVYPEAYMQAAREHCWPSPPLVIGVRTIGAGLAAAVATATSAKLTVSLRPTGHPFDRQVRATDDLLRILDSQGGPCVIVDEGPGLSGSSFGAVADLLEGIGVDDGRMIFMPSHRGEPGAYASAAQLGRWRRCTRLVSTLDDLLRREPLKLWFVDLIGPVEMVEDVSAGGWRRHSPVGRRPPSWPQKERRKFRLWTREGQYIARFAGLGRTGEAAFARAEMLSSAGFIAEPLTLRRGFILQRWVEGEALDSGGLDRGAFIGHLGRYLAFRAAVFPATSDDSASPATLVDMAIGNARELGGEPLAARLEGDLAPFAAVAANLRPIHVDGRLHAWEWLRTAGGGFVKCDALDHSCDHDLIGCQDVMWDIAGACLEFALSPAEERVLGAIAAPERDRSTVERQLNLFKRLYAAFQAGSWTMAAQSQSGDDRILAQERAATCASWLKDMTMGRES